MNVNFACAQAPKFGHTQTAAPPQVPSMASLMAPAVDRVTFSGASTDSHKAAAETFVKKLDIAGTIAELAAQQPGAQTPSAEDLADFEKFLVEAVQEEYSEADLKEMTEDIEQNRVSKEERIGFVMMSLMMYAMEQALGGLDLDGPNPFGGQL